MVVFVGRTTLAMMMKLITGSKNDRLILLKLHIIIPLTDFVLGCTITFFEQVIDFLFQLDLLQLDVLRGVYESVPGR